MIIYEISEDDLGEYISHELAEVAGIVGKSVHKNDWYGDIHTELGNF